MDTEADANEELASPVFDALRRLREAARDLAAATTWSLSNSQSRQAVTQGAAVFAAVESGWLGLVRDLDSRPDAVAGARAGFVARTFLAETLNLGKTAGLDVQVAKAIDPDLDPVDGGLPRVGEVFAAGLISREHVNAAVKAVANLPQRLKKAVFDDGRTGAAKVDAFLAEQSQVLQPKNIDQLGQHLLNLLEPDAANRHDPDGHTRRTLSMGTDQTGMLVGRFQLPAAQAATLRAAIAAFSKPLPVSEGEDEHGRPVLIADDRTGGQRQADALTAIAEIALGDAAQRRAEPPHVVVIATPEQLAQARANLAEAEAEAEARSGARNGSAGQAFAAGRSPGSPSDRPGSGHLHPTADGLAHCAGLGPISLTALARLSCDAVLQAVVKDESDRVLYLGRKTRLATRAQRTALTARDLGCVIPGCDTPPERCDAHHVVWWSEGGRTDIDTMALLCPRHHTDVHSRIWLVRIRDGVPWVQPPHWLRPTPDTWVRNTVHRAREQALKLGEQLRFHLDGAPPHRKRE